MALFLSNHLNKVDRKGRVSVPAPFRAVLADEPYQGVIVFPALMPSHRCLEACGMRYMERLNAALSRMDTEHYDEFAATLFGSVAQLPFDGEGRIILPDHLRAYAGIDDQAIFVGWGKTFRIWEPNAHAAFTGPAIDVARSRAQTLMRQLAAEEER